MNTPPNHAPLVVETRGVGIAQSVESAHYGSIAVVDTAGILLWSVGDAQALTFSRSTLKPFQALPFVEAGGLKAFDFDTSETAMLCASHSGEDMHVTLAERMLRKAECDEHHLQCGCHVPMRYSAFDLAAPAGAQFDQRYNNCSGKHAGFLAYCRMTDTPLDTYLDDGHPLQRAIRARVAAMAGIDEATLAVGIDGCSAPNLAMPLARLARLYALLARPEAADDARAEGAALAPAEALDRLLRAMTGHPELVSGTGRSDLLFMSSQSGTDGQPELVSKVGAAGVQTFGVRSAGLGIAIKIADGNMAALYCAATAVLDQLGLLDDARRAALAQYARPPFRNHRGIVTGEMRPAFALARAA